MADPVSPPSSPPRDSNTTPSTTNNDKTTTTTHTPVTPENKRLSQIGGLSFAERKMSRRPSTAPTPIVEGDGGLTRDVHHSLPGDARNNRKSRTQADMAKRRSSYYEEAFQGDREANVAKDRIYGEAIVMAELRTNVIVCLHIILASGCGRD